MGCRSPRLKVWGREVSAWNHSSEFFSLGWKCSGEDPRVGSPSTLPYMGSPEKRMLQTLLPKRAYSLGGRLP